MPPPAPRPGVFLDRDGTIIEDPGYLGSPDDVRLAEGAAAAIARLNDAGLTVVIVTNQSGIGRGLYGEADYRATHDRLVELLSEAGARVDGAWHCPHAPDARCDCRKPLPGLFLRAASEHGFDPSLSHYVGDRLRDVLPGIELGGTGYLLDTGSVSNFEAAPRHPRLLRVPNLAAAVGTILRPFV